MRDIEAKPYSPDEERVCDFLQEIAPELGCGDDPVGNLIAMARFWLDDRRRLNWLEEQTKKSRTGTSFDWNPKYVEEGMVIQPGGYRFMRHHMIGDAEPDIRLAIDQYRNG